MANDRNSSTLTRDERETIIRRTDADTSWDVFTDNAALLRQLAKKGWKPTAEGTRFFSLPLSAVKIRSRKSVETKRQIPPDRLKAMQDTLVSARKRAKG